MIFITLGSQKFQFNRLLVEIDRLVESGDIKEAVFAQIGYSDYKPKNYEFKEFLDRAQFVEYTDKSNIVITHGGTGAIIGALKKEKKVIAVPRLQKYNEHVDDHQRDIVKQFSQMKLISEVYDVKCIKDKILNIENTKFNTYISNTKAIINEIGNFLNNIK